MRFFSFPPSTPVTREWGKAFPGVPSRPRRLPVLWALSKGQSNCATLMPELRPFDAGRSVACDYPEVVIRAETATAA